ncbi:MAG TPA: DUF1810 domain-containing protein [Verrucomicrobiae bacterium]|jgi:uncharacterized protein (DUF1810 family)|nr:DUF1810 domain-containing protein [Verrucomicrobiae bacterium]
MRRDSETSDPFDLARFVAAQEADYTRALFEIKAGRKRTHWMWYIFPQFDGLGFSSISKFYAIKSRAEAEAYLRHPILGSRLLECVTALLQLDGRFAHDIFGSPDDLKLRSCATLFATVNNDSKNGSIFHRLLTKYYPAQGPDPNTLRLLAM